MGELVSYKTKETEPTGFCMSLVKRDLKCEDVKRKIKKLPEIPERVASLASHEMVVLFEQRRQLCTTKPPDGCN